MKILIVSHNYFPAVGGTEKKIKEISERLVKSGDKVTVFCSNAETTEGYIHPEIPLLSPGNEYINGVKVRRFPVYRGMRPLLNRLHRLFWKYRLPFNDIVRSIWNGPIIFNILPHILKEKTDIIVATPFPFLNVYYAYIAKKIRRIPMVIIPCLHTEDAWGFNRKIIYRILSETEMIMVNTDYEREYLMAYGIESDRVFTLGDGVNPQDFSKANPERFRRKYSIGNSPVVLFVGRKERWKGIDTLVDSMGIVWRKFPRAKLILAGTRTRYLKKIDEKIRSLDANKRKNIIFIDNFGDSEKGDLFASCDIFAMPSKVESFGIAYLEAWAAGKPVIGCRIGAVASLIKDGEDGLLVEYGNHRELASAILKLLNCEDLRRKLAENGKKKTYSKYTWDFIADRFRQGLNLTISRGSGKGSVKKRRLQLSGSFDVLEIDRIYLKDLVKRMMRKVPLLFYIVYFVYRKVSNFAHRTANNDILHKAHFLIKYDPMKLKTYNETLAEKEQYRHSPIARAMPMFMVMNMDTQCNLRCIMCIRQEYSPGALNALQYDFKLFEQVADETFPYAKWVQLAIVAEPLMAHNLREQLRIIKKYSVKLDLVTNATLLNNDDLIGELLQVLGCLHISIDGATKETYESIRIGAKFEQVIENIRRFGRLREKLYVRDKSRLHFAVVLMRRNIKELPKLVELAKELEVDSVDCSHVTVFHERIKNESLVYHKELSNYYMRIAQKRADKLNVHLNIPPLFNTGGDIQGKGSKNNLRNESKICPFLWERAYVEWNGNVLPCCVPNPPIMGNVNERPFREIWNNELYQEMRRRSGTNRSFVCCKRCVVLSPSDEQSLFHIKGIRVNRPSYSFTRSIRI